MSDEERAVLEILRRHPRNVDTILWGLDISTHVSLSYLELLEVLHELEGKGIAEQVLEIGEEWWRLSE